MLGIVMIVIGLYFIFFKAGVPYQDPPPELIIRYLLYMKMGIYFIISGLTVTILLRILRIIIYKSKKTDIKIQ
jgi:hypothetical protein